jgi:hypothetical protein
MTLIVAPIQRTTVAVFALLDEPQGRLVLRSRSREKFRFWENGFGLSQHLPFSFFRMLISMDSFLDGMAA